MSVAADSDQLIFALKTSHSILNIHIQTPFCFVFFSASKYVNTCVHFKQTQWWIKKYLILKERKKRCLLSIYSDDKTVSLSQNSEKGQEEICMENNLEGLKGLLLKPIIVYLHTEVYHIMALQRPPHSRSICCFFEEKNSSSVWCARPSDTCCYVSLASLHALYLPSWLPHAPTRLLNPVFSLLWLELLHFVRELRWH